MVIIDDRPSSIQADSQPKSVGLVEYMRVGSCHLELFYMNGINFRNDFIMITVPQTLSLLSLLLVIIQ